MKKNNKNYKKLFNNLIIENEKKEKIYSNILNSKERKAYFKFAYIIPAIILVLFTGIVFADDIKFTFNSLVVKKIEKENSKGEKLERWSNASEQVKISEYYVKSIKTTALIKSYDELRSLREVLFDYNNVRYLISFTIPNDLDPDTEVLKFLNSLYI